MNAKVVACMSTECPMNGIKKSVSPIHLGQNVYSRFVPICGSCETEMVILRDTPKAAVSLGQQFVREME